MSGPLSIFAAGSLRNVLSELQPPNATLRFGPAGQLRREIEAGAPCDLFLSANLAHPEALASHCRGAEAVCFASNEVVALARHELGMTPERFLDVLLDPGIRLGTSTPGADPGGDYAMALFARAGRIQPGADHMLADKAQQIVGGWGPAVSSPPLATLLGEERVDVFICYCTTALALAGTLEGNFVAVVPPAPLAVKARYGGVALAGDPGRRTAAQVVLANLLGPAGQAALARHGFGPPD